MTRTVLLGDICDVRDGTHDSPKPKDSGHPLVTSKHIKSGKIDVSSANLISNEDYLAVNKRSKVDKWDILMGMIGTVGELAFIDYEPQFAIKNIGLIKTGNKLKGQYLYYYLQSNKAKNHIQSVLAGSTQKFISLGQLRKFPIELPEESTQRQIVDFLSAIDEKIELNRKMNETLEKMGQALFKKYFITNPNAKKVQIGDLITETSSKVGTDNQKDYVVLSAVKTGELVSSEDYFTKKVYSKDISKYKKVNMNEFAYNPARVNIGSIGRLDKDILGAVSPVYVSFKIKEGYENTISELLKLPVTRKRISDLCSGTVRQILKFSDFERVIAYEIDDEELSNFNEKYSLIVELKNHYSNEVKTLIGARDSLLPRLISGKIKI